MNASRRWFVLSAVAGCLVTTGSLASTTAAWANPHRRPVHSGYTRVMALRAAQRVESSANRLERALCECRSARGDAMIAANVARRARQLVDSLSVPAPWSRSTGEFAALRGQFRILESRMESGLRRGQWDPTVARAWCALQADYRALEQSCAARW